MPKISFNTLRPRQNDQRFTDDISKWNFLTWNAWILLKMVQKFVSKFRINNIPALVQIVAWRRPGDKPLFEPMMFNSRKDMLYAMHRAPWHHYLDQCWLIVNRASRTNETLTKRQQVFIMKMYSLVYCGYVGHFVQASFVNVHNFKKQIKKSQYYVYRDMVVFVCRINLRGENNQLQNIWLLNINIFLNIYRRIFFYTNITKNNLNY